MFKRKSHPFEIVINASTTEFASVLLVQLTLVTYKLHYFKCSKTSSFTIWSFLGSKHYLLKT